VEGREGKEEGEETRGRDDPAAAMAQSLARSDSAAAGARCLNLCLAGRACSPLCAGRASRGGEEAVEAQGAPGFNHRRSSPPRSVPHRPRLLAGVRGAGEPASLGSEEAAEAQGAPGFDHRLSLPVCAGRAFLLSPSLAGGHAARRLWINQRAAEPAALSPADLRRRQMGVGEAGPLAAAARPLRAVRPAHGATGAAPAMSAATCARRRGGLLELSSARRVRPGARWRRRSTRRGGWRRRPAEQAPFSLSFPARAPSSRSTAPCSSFASPCSSSATRRTGGE